MKKREPFCSGPCMAQRGSLAWRSCDRDCNFDDLDRGWITPYKDLPDGPTAQDETGGDAELREGVAINVADAINSALAYYGIHQRFCGADDVPWRTSDQIIALIKAPPERDQSREEPKPLSPETSRSCTGG